MDDDDDDTCLCLPYFSVSSLLSANFTFHKGRGDVVSFRSLQQQQPSAASQKAFEFQLSLREKERNETKPGLSHHGPLISYIFSSLLLFHPTKPNQPIIHLIPFHPFPIFLSTEKSFKGEMKQR